jgi:hypothetical protein
MYAHKYIHTCVCVCVYHSLTSQFSNLDNLTSSNALNAQPPRSSGPTLGQMEQQGMPFNQFQVRGVCIHIYIYMYVCECIYVCVCMWKNCE